MAFNDEEHIDFFDKTFIASVMQFSSALVFVLSQVANIIDLLLGQYTIAILGRYSKMALGQYSFLENSVDIGN